MNTGTHVDKNIFVITAHRNVHLVHDDEKEKIPYMKNGLV